MSSSQARSSGPSGAPPSPLASGISGLVGQLIKLPVADPQCGRDVLRIGAVQDQALHGAVERRPGNVGLVLGMDQPLLGLPGPAGAFLPVRFRPTAADLAAAN